ncbi:MAG: DUF2977 domain-containing protein [Prevotella sp.]|nr:DUF2977 domain-containing protein [Prevotella sp.]
MIISVNEKGYVDGYATIGGIVGGIEVPDPENKDLFERHYEEFRYENGELIRDKDRETELANHRAVEELRVRREKECFAVINRGEMWYSLLTDEQKEELKVWYKAWLDVTETLSPPAPLAWV